jgi:hypothetical protein
MSLLYLLFVIVFYGFCVFAIYWLLKHFVSKKPWHRWVRYGVWLSFVGLLTFDTIYYQIAVVHGMCAADKEKVYVAPPVNYVTGGVHSDITAIKFYADKNHYGWLCKEQSTEKYGTCIVENLHTNKYEMPLLFGGSKEVLEIVDNQNDTVYYSEVVYRQVGQWLTRKLFGFGFVFYPQPESCDRPFYSKDTPIIIG